MLVPNSSRVNSKPNALLDLAGQAAGLVAATTPDSDLVDPSLFSPIERNPTAVNDAISALANSRVEAEDAAARVAQDNYNRQLNLLIQQQLLGAGGAIANLGGAGVDTGIQQRSAQAIPQAIALQNQLAQTITNAAKAKAEALGQAGVQTAQNQFNADIANEQARTQGNQQYLAAIERAHARAMQTGNSIRQELQNILSNDARQQQIGISARGVAAQESNAISNRINALKPRAGSGSGDKIDPRSSDAKFDAILTSRARAQEARSQAEGIATSDGTDPAAGILFQASGDVAKDVFQEEQNLQDNIAAFSGAIRRDPIDKVAGYLATGLETGDVDVSGVVVDELQNRYARYPNDPTLKALEQSFNAGLPANQAKSLDKHLKDIERQIESGTLRPLN